MIRTLSKLYFKILAAFFLRQVITQQSEIQKLAFLSKRIRNVWEGKLWLDRCISLSLSSRRSKAWRKQIDLNKSGDNCAKSTTSKPQCNREQSTWHRAPKTREVGRKRENGERKARPFGGRSFLHIAALKCQAVQFSCEKQSTTTTSSCRYQAIVISLQHAPSQLCLSRQAGKLLREWVLTRVVFVWVCCPVSASCVSCETFTLEAAFRKATSWKVAGSCCEREISVARSG